MITEGSSASSMVKRGLLFASFEIEGDVNFRYSFSKFLDCVHAKNIIFPVNFVVTKVNQKK